MSLLSICQEAAAEIGLPQPTSVVGSSDPQSIQMLTLVNLIGKELVRKYEWQALTIEANFTTVAAEVQTVLPADFAHLIDDSMYNRTEQRKVYGPQTPQTWQLDNSFLTTRVYDTFRIKGGNILFEPNPAAGESVYYEYISKYWVDTDADGVGEAEVFGHDSTHASLLPEDLLRLGLVARLKEASGLDYQESTRRFHSLLGDYKSQDKGKKTLRLTGPRGFELGKGNVPDTGFGSV